MKLTGRGSAMFRRAPICHSIPFGAPLVSICRATTNRMADFWPSPATGWGLQQHSNSVRSLSWSNVTSGFQETARTSLSTSIRRPGTASTAGINHEH